MVSESQDRQIEHDAIKSEVVLPKKKKKTQSMSVKCGSKWPQEAGPHMSTLPCPLLGENFRT